MRLVPLTLCSSILLWTNVICNRSPYFVAKNSFGVLSPSKAGSKIEKKSILNVLSFRGGDSEDVDEEEVDVDEELYLPGLLEAIVVKVK